MTFTLINRFGCVVLMMGHVATTWLMNRPIESVVINGAFQRVSAVRNRGGIVRPRADRIS